MAKNTFKRCVVSLAMIFAAGLVPTGLCSTRPCSAQDHYRDQAATAQAFEAAEIRQAAYQADAMDHQSLGDFPALIQFEDAERAEQAADESLTEMAGPMVTTVCALTVVLAVFGGLVWVSRRFGSARPVQGVLPDDVLRNLGSAAIDAKTRVTFLKVGARILVLGQTDNGQPQTLSEITDPDEVDRLTGRCLGRPEIVGRRTGYSNGAESIRRDLAAG